jgi:hypothetical protein
MGTQDPLHPANVIAIIKKSAFMSHPINIQMANSTERFCNERQTNALLDHSRAFFYLP